jgi:hypothetical protein
MIVGQRVRRAAAAAIGGTGRESEGKKKNNQAKLSNRQRSDQNEKSKQKGKKLNAPATQ